MYNTDIEEAMKAETVGAIEVCMAAQFGHILIMAMTSAYLGFYLQVGFDLTGYLTMAGFGVAIAISLRTMIRSAKFKKAIAKRN